MTGPLMFELFCGLGGASEGAMSEGYRCVGFDIEVHNYGNGRYPGQLILQDVLTIHGKQLKGADFIWASPPCQEFSYMAMPWSRAKQIARALRGHGEFPEGYTGSRTIAELTALFDACLRIQREASEAAGRHIPMVVENVRGAQPWVGRAPWNYGSFYLWGDVPALMPFTRGREVKQDGRNFHFMEKYGITSPSFHGADHEPNVIAALEKTGKPGRSFQSAAVEQMDGVKLAGNATSLMWSQWEHKRDWGLHLDGDTWKDAAGNVKGRDRASARKAASAQIAKIPFELARWIASVYKPREREQVA